MERVWRDVCRCQLCDIAKYARCRVFGDGNISAKIALVGEAPGMDEDKSGHVFIGVAGRILRKCLLAAGIDPKEVFIANILKCHPPKILDPPSGNRKPAVQEIANCLPFLKRQLNIINPAVIVALGNTAAEGLLRPEIKKVKVTSMFGQTFEKDGRTIILTYHPQYLGYKAHDPSLERDYIELFRKIKRWKK